MTILWCVLAIILVCFIGYILYFCCSPMPIVRLLRKGSDATASWPVGLEHSPDLVSVEKDLVYPSRYGRNYYDLYYPKHATKPLPVLIWVHGGAFVAGNKTGVVNWATCLAANGIAVAAVEYQWAPEACWPAQVQQIEECCLALKELAEKKGLDMNQVVIAGDSAGAHMAAQFALIHTSPSFRQSTKLMPVLDSNSLKAVLLYCGPYDIGLMARPKDRFMRLALHRIGWSYLGKKHWQNTPQAQATVIKDYLTAQFPPTYITDGNTGSFEKQGRLLATVLSQQNVQVSTRFFEAKDGQVNHEYQFDLEKPNARACYDDTIAFLQQIDFC